MMKLLAVGILAVLTTAAPTSHAQMGDVKEAERRAELGRFKALQRDVKMRVATIQAKVREIEKNTAQIRNVEMELAKLNKTTYGASNLNNLPGSLPSAVLYVLKHALNPVLTSNPQNPTQDMRNLEVLDRYAKEAQREADAENAKRLAIFREREAERRKILQLAKRSF